MRWFFLDRILALETGKYAKAIKNVTFGEDFLEDHFPGYPVMPYSIIIEALAQIGGVLAGSEDNFRKDVILAKIEKVNLYDIARPGDQIVLEAHNIVSRDEGWRVEASASVGSKKISEADMMFVNLSSEDNGPKGFVFSKDFMTLLQLSQE